MIPIGAGIQLSCSSKQGAVLIIKEPASRFQSKKRKKLGEELKKNYKSWHKFLCETFGELPLRQMVFVTGCDLTSDWATATFDDRVVSGDLSFKVCDPQSVSGSLSMWGRWESSMSVPVRCGPSLEQKRVHVMEGDANSNQCIFVRGWRISERFKPLPPKLRGAAEPKDDEPESDDGELREALLCELEVTSSVGCATRIFDDVADIHECMISGIPFPMTCSCSSQPPKRILLAPFTMKCSKGYMMSVLG